MGVKLKNSKVQRHVYKFERWFKLNGDNGSSRIQLDLLEKQNSKEDWKNGKNAQEEKRELKGQIFYFH